MPNLESHCQNILEGFATQTPLFCRWATWVPFQMLWPAQVTWRAELAFFPAGLFFSSSNPLGLPWTQFLFFRCRPGVIFIHEAKFCELTGSGSQIKEGIFATLILLNYEVSEVGATLSITFWTWPAFTLRGAGNNRFYWCYSQEVEQTCLQIRFISQPFFLQVLWKSNLNGCSQRWYRGRDTDDKTLPKKTSQFLKWNAENMTRIVFQPGNRFLPLRHPIYN